MGFFGIFIQDFWDRDLFAWDGKHKKAISDFNPQAQFKIMLESEVIKIFTKSRKRVINKP